MHDFIQLPLDTMSAAEGLKAVAELKQKYNLVSNLELEKLLS
jgi:hypothetical protein